MKKSIVRTDTTTATSEKTKSFGNAYKLLLAISAFGTMTTVSYGAILPSGATVVNGGVSFAVTQNHMQIKQATDKAILEWDSFSVGKGNSVHFEQPSAVSSVLNRVVGNEKSTVAGTITATGQVFLINPNGILFTDTANVNTAGFVASTLDIANTDFLNSNYTSFTNLKNAKNNAGTTATVENRGYIASEYKTTIALYGGDVIQGGTVTTRGGKIILSANNTTTVSGNINTSDTTENIGTGGQIDVSAGEKVTLTDTAKITAIGTEWGGLVRIGGAYQYKYPLAGYGLNYIFRDRWGALDTIIRSNNTFMEKGASIDVSAITAGGTVLLKSKQNTKQLGKINANGLAGGAVEIVSQGNLLAFQPNNISIGQGAFLLGIEYPQPRIHFYEAINVYDDY